MCIRDSVQVLFSTGYQGWISWSPLILPSIIGLVILTIRGHSSSVRILAVASLMAIVGMIAIDLVHPFGPGASFGGRRYISTTPLLTLGLAALPTLTPPQHRRGWVVLVSILTLWSLWLLLSYELLIIIHGVYPTLIEASAYAVGLGAP